MKRLFTKGLAAVAVLVSIGFLASSCEHEPISNKGSQGSVSLQRVSGGSQKGRIRHIDFGKQAKLQKRYRLNYVATIEAPLEHRDWKWSATSVTVDPGRKVYITWHSNLQAKETENNVVWGGALDVVDITGFSFVNSYLSTGKMKFNNLLISDNTFFLAATHFDFGGAVARVGMKADGDLLSDNVDCIGFPGASVNAIAKCNNNRLLAVSGYNKGTYAFFAPDVQPQAYNYVNDKKNVIEPKTESLVDFGGKYVVSEGNNAYILRDAEGGAEIIDLDGNVINLGVRLTSAPKQVEIYNDETGKWELSGEEQTYYGKHTMVVYNNIAYVACGYNGLLWVNLTTGAVVRHNQNLLTVGLAISGNRLFAATGMGLRIYDIKEDGSLELYAFEVETYDETGTGAPTSDDPATVGTPKRHSPNFVAVDELNGYIYIAYGQSGVRVYEFETGVDMGGTVLWSPVGLPGYYAWGEIFCLEDKVGETFEFEGQTYRNNDGSYYPFTGAKDVHSYYRDFDKYKFYDIDSYLNWTPWKAIRLTKYQRKEQSGKDQIPVAIDYSVLQPMDDAATVRLGKGWRMPTKEEWEELLALHSETVDIAGGKGGICFVAENGTTLTLPQNGYRGWSTPDKYNDSCFYWTSSLSDVVGLYDGDGKWWPGGFMSAASFKKKYFNKTDQLLRNVWCLEAKAVCFVAPHSKFGKKPYMHLHDRCCGMGIWPVKDKPSPEETKGASK